MTRKLDKWERRFLEWPFGDGWARYFEITGFAFLALGVGAFVWFLVRAPDATGSATVLMVIGVWILTQAGATRAIAGGRRLLEDAGGVDRKRSFEGEAVDDIAVDPQAKSP